MGDGPPRLVGDSDSEGEEPGAGTQNDETSDEEAELPGTTRPKRGAGWWGRGPTLRPHRKGIAKTFIDGAGFPSPGRWSPTQRNLPEDGTAEKLKSIFKRGLQDSVEQLPGGSLRTAMAALAAGKCDDSPFPKDVVDRVRMDLRLALCWRRSRIRTSTSAHGGREASGSEPPTEFSRERLPCTTGRRSGPSTTSPCASTGSGRPTTLR